MESLLDLYGFLSVVLQALLLLARTVLLGSVVFWALLVVPLGAAMPGAAYQLAGTARRLVLGAGLAGAAGLATALCEGHDPLRQ